MLHFIPGEDFKGVAGAFIGHLGGAVLVKVHRRLFGHDRFFQSREFVVALCHCINLLKRSSHCGGILAQRRKISSLFSHSLHLFNDESGRRQRQ
jgi:hypothetical protein